MNFSLGGEDNVLPKEITQECMSVCEFHEAHPYFCEEENERKYFERIPFSPSISAKKKSLKSISSENTITSVKPYAYDFRDSFAPCSSA